MEDKPIIQIENLTMRRGDKILLDDVDLTIKEGEIVFFLGKNGCGKSTLLSLFRKTKDAKTNRSSKIKNSSQPTFGGSFKLTCGDKTEDLVTCNFRNAESSVFYYDNIAYLDQSDLFESFARVKRTMSIPTLVALTERYNAVKSRPEFKDKRVQLFEEYRKDLELLRREVDNCIKELIVGFDSNYSAAFEKQPIGELSDGQKKVDSNVKEHNDGSAFVKDRTNLSDGTKLADNSVKELVKELDRRGAAFAKKHTRNLSGGQKRFVSFCRTYIMAKVLKSKVLVLDEPLNHLDYQYKKCVDDMLDKLIQERRDANNPITLLIVSHCLPFKFIKYDYCRQIDYRNGKLVERIPKTHHECLNECYISEE